MLQGGWYNKGSILACPSMYEAYLRINFVVNSGLLWNNEHAIGLSFALFASCIYYVGAKDTDQKLQQQYGKPDYYWLSTAAKLNSPLPAYKTNTDR